LTKLKFFIQEKVLLNSKTYEIVLSRVEGLDTWVLKKLISSSTFLAKRWQRQNLKIKIFQRSFLSDKKTIFFS